MPRPKGADENRGASPAPEAPPQEKRRAPSGIQAKLTRLPADIPSLPPFLSSVACSSVYRFHKKHSKSFWLFSQKNVFHGGCFGKVSETYAIFIKFAVLSCLFLGIMITLFTKEI